MKQFFIGLSLVCGLALQTNSQQALAQNNAQQEDSSWKKTYRAVATKTNNLRHTKLVANFNYEKAQMNGEVWLKLHPHFDPTNQLI